MDRPPSFLTDNDNYWSGKVREMYLFGTMLLIVTTDRISAFDVVLPTLIPDKGRVLTKLSEAWFLRLGLPHHMVTTDLDIMHAIDPRIDFGRDREYYEGRCMLVRKAKPFLVECVVRGYLAGSSWADYQRTGRVCGIELPRYLVESQRLPKLIFTPATKATDGHDENITFEQAVEIIGSEETAQDICEASIRAYQEASAYALERGIIIADTKLEFGIAEDTDEIVLIDEVLTPDSSRFWPLDQYRPGRAQPSFDKQYVRDYLTKLGWNRRPPAPELPPEVVVATREKYVGAYEKLIGAASPWRDTA